MIDPWEIIKKLESDNSRLFKEDVVKENLKNLIFQEGLAMCLDALVTFGVKQVPESNQNGKGLDWKTHEVNLFKSEQYSSKYLKINPKGVVPTLVVDGQPVIESTLICEYLDETYPEPSLMPRDAISRSRMRLWSKAVDEGLFEGVVELSFSAMFSSSLGLFLN